MPPISIGLSIPHLEQAFWQYFSVGQTRAQIAPKALLFLTTSAAPSRFWKRTALMNLAGSVKAGQADEQGASLHKRHLAASS